MIKFQQKQEQKKRMSKASIDRARRNQKEIKTQQ